MHNPKLSELPVAEQLYQLFHRHHGELIDHLDEAQAKFSWADAPNRRIDSRVHYPLDLTTALTVANCDDNAYDPFGMSAALPSLLHAFGNYRRTKTIYTIDQALLHHLVDVKWSDDTPIEAAALPVNGCVLDLPAHEVFGSENIQGTNNIQVFCSYDENYRTGGLDLVLIAVSLKKVTDDHFGFVPLPDLYAWMSMSSPSLKDAILDYTQSVRESVLHESTNLIQHGADPEAMIRANDEKFQSQDWFRYLKTVLSALIYIKDQDDLVAVGSPSPLKGFQTRLKRRRLTSKQSGPKNLNSRLPKHFLVGKHFTASNQH